MRALLYIFKDFEEKERLKLITYYAIRRGGRGGEGPEMIAVGFSRLSKMYDFVSAFLSFCVDARIRR